MKLRTVVLSISAAFMLAMAGCSSTAGGAVAGGLIGNVASDGSTAATIGGAAAGAVLSK